MALEKWFTSEVTRIEDETENAKRFFMKVPELEVLNFKAGQFVTFDLPIHEKKNRRWRSYSIVSPPSASNEFELLIGFVPNGPASKYFWNDVQVGTTIPFKGPAGIFVLPGIIETDLCLIATSTGIAPFRSMLLDLVSHPRSIKNLYLVFGTRYIKDIFYREELEQLQTKIPGFKFLLTLSREDSPEYTGRKGYVHPVYEELFADKRSAQFYISGWKNMIDDAKKRILAMGYDRKLIHVEIYG
ncbi:MAG TPA: FAD-binding oxidoreductase [Chitinophagales bacterium]|nr:FAD-binding oxidoreductase [Chitinophagales bacterium]